MFVYIFRERMLPVLVKYFWLLLAIYTCWVHGNSCFLHLKIGLYVDVVQGVLVCLLTLAFAYKFGKRSLRHDYLSVPRDIREYPSYCRFYSQLVGNRGGLYSYNHCGCIDLPPGGGTSFPYP